MYVHDIEHLCQDIIDTNELWGKCLLPVGRDHLAAVFIDGSPIRPQFHSDKGLVEGRQDLMRGFHQLTKYQMSLSM
jgi:hypothetical protein